VQLHPQDTTIAELRDAWKRADDLGVDSIFTWDHFYPLYGDPDAAHFEGMTLLTAMAVDTSHAQVGLLVGCNSYRNPQLHADMIRTIDHLSGGRAILGIGSGWFQRDYDEYGYEFGTGPSRLRDLRRDLPLIKERLGKLNPAPVGPVPILIGGSGEKVTLKLTAQHADMWNTFGPPDSWKRKNEILDQHCADVGRDPAAIERTVGIGQSEWKDWEGYAAVGAQHLIIMAGNPYDLSSVEKLLAAVR
jgi:probable F420-dependent oxidoreductase